VAVDYYPFAAGHKTEIIPIIIHRARLTSRGNLSAGQILKIQVYIRSNIYFPGGLLAKPGRC
jgi:hypothetical protein